MTAKELFDFLKQVVDSGQGDHKVVIPVSSTESFLGPQPTETISQASYGFDWDSGKIFLHPTKPVAEFKNEK